VNHLDVIYYSPLQTFVIAQQFWKNWLAPFAVP